MLLGFYMNRTGQIVISMLQSIKRKYRRVSILSFADKKTLCIMSLLFINFFTYSQPLYTHTDIIALIIFIIISVSVSAELLKIK